MSHTLFLPPYSNRSFQEEEMKLRSIDFYVTLSLPSSIFTLSRRNEIKINRLQLVPSISLSPSQVTNKTQTTTPFNSIILCHTLSFFLHIQIALSRRNEIKINRLVPSISLSPSQVTNKTQTILNTN